MGEELVLVTGGSGFVGAHCIIQLLQAGYRVRTTVRSLKREANVRAMLRTGGTEPGDRLQFAAADLLEDAGWVEAVKNCKYVLHVASPFPAEIPKDENDLIIPARDGALRVLRAARDAGVQRVVLTSSEVAVDRGHEPRDTPFDETSWTDLAAGGMTAYYKSKTLAERAVWKFIATEGKGLELSTVNPVGIFGPVLGPDFSASILLVQRFLDGAVLGCPRIYVCGVDVRDVADLHLRAMTHPAARGERFLAVAGPGIFILDMAKMLKHRLGASAKRVPTRQLPDFVMRIAALFEPSLRLVLPELGKIREVTSEKAMRMLGWTPRSLEASLIATAESLIQLGLLKPS